MRKLKITELNRLAVEDFKKEQKTPLVIVLDNIRSMHNVGSVFRTADAFRLEGIYLCGISACPPQAEIHKTALGAEDSVDWQYFEQTEEAIQKLKTDGYEVFALEQAEHSLSLPDFQAEQGKKYALVLGNEVHGVQQSVIDLCDKCLEIPQFGTKHSLNVSIASGIAIWQMVQGLLPKGNY